MKALRAKSEVSQRRNSASRLQHQLLPEFSACQHAAPQTGGLPAPPIVLANSLKKKIHTHTVVVLFLQRCLTNIRRQFSSCILLVRLVNVLDTSQPTTHGRTRLGHQSVCFEPPVSPALPTHSRREGSEQEEHQEGVKHRPPTGAVLGHHGMQCWSRG